jgi:hypothetical protein
MAMFCSNSTKRLAHSTKLPSLDFKVVTGCVAFVEKGGETRKRAILTLRWKRSWHNPTPRGKTFNLSPLSKPPRLEQLTAP